MLRIIRHHTPTVVIICCYIIAITATIFVVSGAAAHQAISDQQQTLHPHISPNLHPKPHSKPTPKPLPSPIVPDVRIPPIENGLAPIVTSLPTSQPVVFLGIDDGAHKTADELQLMNDNHIKASLFLSQLFISENPEFFKDFVKSGNLIENHTLSHHTNMINEMGYEQQKAEICGMADYEEQQYGRRPILFRPPGGAYNLAMQRAAADCGMKAIVTWIAKANGGSMQYQIGDHLRPGDVVLMHFRPEFAQDMQAFLDAMKSQGLHTELIENWLP